MNKRDERCKCSLAISMTGNGCRYCQPQTYIDMMQREIEAVRKQLAAAENRIRNILELAHDALSDDISIQLMPNDFADESDEPDMQYELEERRMRNASYYGYMKKIIAIASPDRRDGHPDGESA